MAMHQGERYECNDADCGCEVQVTRGAQTEQGHDANPRCCCGEEMERKEVTAGRI